MTSEEVKGWLRDNLERKCSEWGLPHWRVALSFCRKEQADDGFQCFMSVSRRFEYERAEITVDAEICAAHNTVEELEEDFEHELSHLVHSPFDLVWDILGSMLTEEELATVDVAFVKASEMTVRNIERLVFSLRRTANEAVAIPSAGEPEAGS